MRRARSGERKSALPHKLNEFFLELANERDDRVRAAGPDDHRTFVALYTLIVRTARGRRKKTREPLQLMMNAPHRSLSGLGNILIVSTIDRASSGLSLRRISAQVLDAVVTLGGSERTHEQGLRGWRRREL